jgi:hypothetical protein
MANPNWKPGVSGNPNGRPPKGQALTDVLREKADAQEIADQLLAMARDGDLGALKYIYDRIDGKPRESVDMSHTGHIDNRPDLSELTDEELEQYEQLLQKAFNWHTDTGASGESTT